MDIIFILVILVLLGINIFVLYNNGILKKNNTEEKKCSSCDISENFILSMEFILNLLEDEDYNSAKNFLKILIESNEEVVSSEEEEK